MTDQDRNAQDNDLNDLQLADVDAQLQQMAAGTGDPLTLVAGFIAALRPANRRQFDLAPRAWREMLRLLQDNPPYCRALADTLLAFISTRDQRRFFTEAGMLPNTGFFSELRRKLVHRVLPELPDTGDLKDCVHLIFTHRTDQEWMESIPAEDKKTFWELLDVWQDDPAPGSERSVQQLVESTVILACRIAAMGIEPELTRVNPRLNDGDSPFLALAGEVIRFAEGCRSHNPDNGRLAEDERHLLVLLDQCRKAVQRAHQTSASCGTSMPLTYIIVRLGQHLDRLELLVELLAVRFRPELRPELAERLSTFLVDALAGERQRNSLRNHFSSLLVILSLRVTENASQVGEHYIAKDGAEKRAILRAAAGGGFLIAFMALLKLLGTSPKNPVFAQGMLNSIIYAGGFVVIYMLHFTVATKQPAMTAATIAATISQNRGRLKDAEALVTLIINTVQSQLAAIVGNVMVALPLAIAVATAFRLNLDAHLILETKAAKLLAENDPLQSASVIYAAVAGVWLFLSGLFTGYVDNLTAYTRIGERLAQTRWLVKLAGEDRGRRIGAYIDAHAGGLAGNIFFGCALGMTPALGKAFGLPLDIRHIAFTSANIGYALTALDWQVNTMMLLRSFFGVALIGGVNLLVSFSLALWVALMSRGVEPRQALSLIPALWRKARSV